MTPDKEATTEGLTQDRLNGALNAHAASRGGLMVGDKIDVDGYTVTIGHGSSPTEITVRITPPAAPIGDHRSTTGFRIVPPVVSETQP